MPTLYPNGMTGGVAGDFDTEPDVPLTRVLAFGELDVGGDAVVENATCMSNSVVCELLKLRPHLHIATMHSNVH